MRIALIGAGAWGTALAIVFAERHGVTLWSRVPEERRVLREERRSLFLPDQSLPHTVAIAEEIEPALLEADIALVATPTAGLRESAALIAQSAPQLPLIWACKGFEADSDLLPHQVVAEVMGQNARCAALSGPSFAQEVARGQPTALTLAATDVEFAKRIAAELHQPRLRVYFSDDMVGVEVGGAVKNVMAIATGICDGLSLGHNARAALLTRGLAELTRLGVALGGQPQTFMGLTGLGDLVLTCTGDLSRNRTVGLQLGRGLALDAILKQLGHVAEGVLTAQAVERRAARAGVEMPITQGVCDVLFRGVSAREAAEQLLARDPKAEHARR